MTIKCGDAETEMEFPFTVVNENLAKVYKKHVVVRFPVQATKEADSEDIYEEIWKDLKGGDHAELTVTDLDEKFDATGKLFVTDLFATANHSLVTIEEANERTMKYKVARLEGDLDVTNLTTPVAQFRIKLNLTNNAFNSFGGFGSNATDVIYSAYVDLSEDADTVVVDFLTDYKAARVKNLVDAGKDFAEASKLANKELAAALYLQNKDSDEYPSFEHFVPDQLGLAEQFNSIVWVMALIDQSEKTPSFNAVYNAYRKVFGENGNFNTAVKTTYAGKERSMYFVDYLAMLIDANFYRWSCWQNGNYDCETNVWNETDAAYYKIVQYGFVDVYKLDATKAKVYKGSDDGEKSRKVLKSDVEDGYFRYFQYFDVSETWFPITYWVVGAATAEQECSATLAAAHTMFSYSIEDEVFNAICQCNGEDCGWEEVVNPGITDAIAETTVSKNGKTVSEIMNDGRFGECNDNNAGTEKTFNLREAMLATTTGFAKVVCDGKRWRLYSELDEKYGACTKSVMNLAEIKDDGYAAYKCDYLDKQEMYSWINATDSENRTIGACHYGRAEEGSKNEEGDYQCRTTGTDDNGNHVHEWIALTPEELFGTCSEAVMIDISKNLQSFKADYYKCDCEKDGNSYKSCGWVMGSEEEMSLRLACTANILGEVSGAYVCLDANVGHNWRTVSAEEWCPKHGQNLTGGMSYHGICDDVPGDNTTYLLIGSASSWAQVPNTYRWNDDNITTADKKAVEAQLISGNSCTDKDIVSLLYDYTIKGTTDRVHDFICKNGKLRVAKDEQEACGKVYETTELCKYMKNWYKYDNGTWRKPTCDDVSFDATGHFCDARDNGSVTVYRKVTIGEGENAQTWMAENLNYETENSKCGGGSETSGGNCDVYGRLYTWTDLQNICPSGWHLPDTTEWRILASNVDHYFMGFKGDDRDNNKVGQLLKSKNGWGNNGNGTDTYLFSALPAGYYDDSDDKYYPNAYFWTSTENSNDDSFLIRLTSANNYVRLTTGFNVDWFSVRCIKD
ncbi:FISUMP domain-containing protein [Fibrobacter sp. UWB11]|uniref:FISUMP domain-containing protein n=1 Tax=Fibrobacter sp. UWB11 TaxID=1896202 RepID=UPI0009277138|nr:FISUMP domain-containing protein [Fibrobacter sp. UWB11]SIO45624.1 major paralogous domain-containing protein [Fibrobacter sp. UWB11]